MFHQPVIEARDGPLKLPIYLHIWAISGSRGGCSSDVLDAEEKHPDPEAAHTQ